ncbi:MAG TPA: ATP-binding protein [Epulopiscium sp.]|nr:ATP-binding protein [Candidatus Epulonipiscium sp.]
MSSQSIQNTQIAMESLGIYRTLLKDPVISKLKILLEFVENNPTNPIGILSTYNEFYHTLMEKGKGCSLKNYMIVKILFQDNIYARLVQNNIEIEPNNPIRLAAIEDLGSLYEIASIIPNDIKNAIVNFESLMPILIDKFENLPQWEENNLLGLQKEYDEIIQKFQNSLCWKERIDDLAYFHKENGSGMWAEFKGFVWEGEQLQGVLSLDPIRMDSLIGYEIERQKVIDNTLAFLDGYPANNMLLYGGRGTGKSSTVKALLNEYYDKGLRIIEISKDHLSTFPKVIRQIKDYPQKFILFIDDLSFEDGKGAYTSLKAVLEGGLETRPSNVVIYATSNRRHLIKEKFSDRAGLSSVNASDEVRAADTMQEKLSLSDRFGITVTFTTPNQKQYLEIVEGLAKSRNIAIPKEDLYRKAIQWEMWYNARSPRTATQFIDWLESQEDYRPQPNA